LELEVNSLFPDVACERMDTDTMRKPGSHEDALNRFRTGEVRILLGTQMIAKGLDFPNVTLVGVVNADTALHFPDFRAAERTFGLVTQVAGRTGRGKKGGRVLVQTFSPDHPAIEAAKRHDYVRFAHYELRERQQHGYPPFSNLARVVVRSESNTLAAAMSDQLANAIGEIAQQQNVELTILGPAPATVEKLRGKYRYHILMKAAQPAGIQGVLRQVQQTVPSVAGVQWIVDMDPQDML